MVYCFIIEGGKKVVVDESERWKCNVYKVGVIFVGEDRWLLRFC